LVSSPTGNLIGFSALSLMAESSGIFLDGFAGLRPEGGLLNQGFFTQDFLHDKAPPLSFCSDVLQASL
jgi:hypothetical protein